MIRRAWRQLCRESVAWGAIAAGALVLLGGAVAGAEPAALVGVGVAAAGSAPMIVSGVWRWSGRELGRGRP